MIGRKPGPSPLEQFLAQLSGKGEDIGKLADAATGWAARESTPYGTKVKLSRIAKAAVELKQALS